MIDAIFALLAVVVFIELMTNIIKYRKRYHNLERDPTALSVEELNNLFDMKSLKIIEKEEKTFIILDKKTDVVTEVCEDMWMLAQRKKTNPY